MISDKFNFIFFHVPKVAGSSITKALSQNLTDSVLVNENNSRFKKFLSKTGKLWPNHATCREVKAYLGEQRYSNYFKFCFVRNPWDRLVSLYHYTVQKEAKIYAEKGIKLSQFNQQIINAGSFENWIKTGKLGSTQTQFLTDTNGKLLVDFIGRSENLQPDFSYICGHLRTSNIILPKVNVSNRKSYQQYYNDETKQIAAKWCAKDIELFGYSFEEDSNPKMLAINQTFIDSQHQPFIKVINTKNRNKYCRFTTAKLQYQDNLHLHPNNVGEPDLELEILLQAGSNKPITNLSFYCNAYNENADNPGVIIEYQIMIQGQKQAADKIKLKPRSKQKIDIKFRSINSGILKLKIVNVPEVNSNKFCGVRLNNFMLN